MAINKNHEFEDLDGIKCSIVERNANKDRTDFLVHLLELNHYKVVVVPTPAPVSKPQAATDITNNELTETLSAPEVPEAQTFTIGVTDVRFNPTNAIFGRLLHTANGHVVTLAYWKQEEKESHDEVPYFEKLRS